MSGLAEILLNLGHEVSGSDLRASEITARLEELGLRFQEGHDAANVARAFGQASELELPQRLQGHEVGQRILRCRHRHRDGHRLRSLFRGAFRRRRGLDDARSGGTCHPDPCKPEQCELPSPVVHSYLKKIVLPKRRLVAFNTANAAHRFSLSSVRHDPTSRRAWSSW